MKTVMFDIGHGGKDPGAIGFGLHEADVVLKIGTLAGNHLLKNYEGVRVIYTRTSDVYLSLDERTDLANKEKVDFYYSFHINSSDNPLSKGFETFVYLNPGPVSIAYQNVIHGEIMQFLKKYNIVDRGKKRKDLHVLRESNMAAVLAEYLFIVNKKENELLRDENFLAGLAEVTAVGIAKAIGLKEKPKQEAAQVEDKAQIVSPFAKEAHAWVKENGISDGSRPQEPVTRQEVWVMLHNMKKGEK